jgi:flagellar biosynthesis/type III secretory pathway protein FliH
MDPVYERQIPFHAFLQGVRCEVTDSGSLPEVECKTVQARTDDSGTNPQDAASQADANAALAAQLLEHNSTMLDTILETLQDLDESRRNSLREMQDVACELAILVATYVIQKQIEKEDFPIEKLVAQAIDRLESDDPLTMHLHSDDLVSLNHLWESTDQSRPENVRFVADDSLSRGSCFAESKDYGLLSTLDARLAEIRQALLEGIDDAQTERRRTDEKSEKVRRFPDRRETA